MGNQTRNRSGARAGGALGAVGTGSREQGTGGPWGSRCHVPTGAAPGGQQRAAARSSLRVDLGFSWLRAPRRSLLLRELRCEGKLLLSVVTFERDAGPLYSAACGTAGKTNVREPGCVRNLKGKKPCVLLTWKLWPDEQEGWGGGGEILIVPKGSQVRRCCVCGSAALLVQNYFTFLELLLQSLQRSFELLTNACVWRTYELVH